MKSWLNCAFIATIACVVSACDPDSPQEDQREAAFAASISDTQGLVQYLSGNTHSYFGNDSGTTYEFLSSDGRAYGWFAGQRSAVSGNWRVESSQTAQTQICFSYAGSGWRCYGKQILVDNIFQSVQGDPFMLRSGRVPTVLPAKNWYGISDYIPIEDMMSLIGKNPSALQEIVKR